MKKKYLIFLLIALLPTMLMPTTLMAQTAGGQVVRPTPKPKPKPTPKPRPTPTPKPKPQPNPNHNAGARRTSNPVLQNLINNMVYVEGGTFMMGLEGDNLAEPVHQVTLSDYCIGETEVTQALWQTVVGYNPSHNKSNENLSGQRECL